MSAELKHHFQLFLVLVDDVLGGGSVSLVATHTGFNRSWAADTLFSLTLLLFFERKKKKKASAHWGVLYYGLSYTIKHGGDV